MPYISKEKNSLELCWKSNPICAALHFAKQRLKRWTAIEHFCQSNDTAKTRTKWRIPSSRKGNCGNPCDGTLMPCLAWRKHVNDMNGWSAAISRMSSELFSLSENGTEKLRTQMMLQFTSYMLSCGMWLARRVSCGPMVSLKSGQRRSQQIPDSKSHFCSKNRHHLQPFLKLVPEVRIQMNKFQECDQSWINKVRINRQNAASSVQITTKNVKKCPTYIIFLCKGHCTDYNWGLH